LAKPKKFLRTKNEHPANRQQKASEAVTTTVRVYANGDRLAVLRPHKYKGGGTCEVLSIDAPFNGKLNTYVHPDSLGFWGNIREPREVGLEIRAEVFCVHICENREAAMRVMNELLGTSYQ
jgi:hypothetical protein